MLLAFSQFCFFTGNFQVQAEENISSQPTAETTVPAPVETVEVQSIEEAVPVVETPADSVPETDAPTTNSKATLDQTIGETQNPGDSPAVTQLVEPETGISPELSEESTSSSTPSSEPAETTDTPETKPAEGNPTPEVHASPESSVEKTTDAPAVDTEKPAEQPVDTKDTEEKPEAPVVASDTKETTLSDKEVEKTFVVQPRAARVRRAAVSNGAANQTVHVDRNYGSATIGWSQSNGNKELGYYAKRDDQGNMLWCIEPGVPLDWGANGGFTTSTSDDSKYKKAALAVYWGWETQKSILNAFYTEKLVQEITTDVTTSGIYDLAGQASQAGYEAFKKAVMEKVNAVDKRPSFHNETKIVKIGETLILEDTNNVLSYYKVANDSTDVTVKIEGNMLKITPKDSSKLKGNIRFQYNIDRSYQGATIVYTAPGLQDVINAKAGDPNSAVLNLNVLKQGNLEILKIDADTKKPLANAEIKVTINGKDQTVKTNEKGIALVKDITHGTKGTVVEIKAPTGYVLNKISQDFTIEANKTIKVTIENKEQLGIAKLFKEDAETGNKAQGAATLEGAVYGLYQADGTKIKSITLKNINGKVQAEVKDLKLGSYYWLGATRFPISA